jgi:hypothetical protein
MPKDMFDKFKILRDETSSQINTVHSDFVNKIWNGQVANLDAEWEQYIEQIYAAGLDKWVEIWNSEEIKTYDYYNNVK